MSSDWDAWKDWDCKKGNNHDDDESRPLFSEYSDNNDDDDDDDDDNRDESVYDMGTRLIWNPTMTPFEEVDQATVPPHGGSAQKTSMLQKKFEDWKKKAPGFFSKSKSRSTFLWEYQQLEGDTDDATVPSHTMPPGNRYLRAGEDHRFGGSTTDNRSDTFCVAWLKEIRDCIPCCTPSFYLHKNKQYYVVVLVVSHVQA